MIGRPVAKALWFVSDDMVFDTLVIHPFAEQGDEAICFRALAPRIRHQNRIDGLTSCDHLYDHRGRIDAPSPRRQDWRTNYPPAHGFSSPDW